MNAPDLINNQKRLALYALLVVFMMLAINLLSGYIRHMEAGLDCDNWPTCYAQIGASVAPESEQQAVDVVTEANVANVAQMALAPTHPAKRTHRIVATVFVVIILLLVKQSREAGALAKLQGVNRQLPYLLVAMVLFLAIIGPASYLKIRPAIGTGNILGGLGMLALSWWLWLQLSVSRLQSLTPPLQRLRFWARLGFAALCMQIALGAWVSANFAATSCPELFSCGLTDAQADTGIWQSFWYFRELALSDSHHVISDGSSVLIHLVHRLGAVITAAILLFVGVSAWRAGNDFSGSAQTVIILLLLQLALGGLAVWAALPLAVVLGHNLIASLLLLALIRLNFLLPSSSITDSSSQSSSKQ